MGFDQHFKTLVPGTFLMIIGNVYLWSQIVSLWIVVPAAIVFLIITLDIFAGVFLSLFAQVILLGTGLAVLD